MKEVYIAYGKESEVLYVGQGNIGRHSHCTSGASHNRHLNEYLFKHGEGSIRVEIHSTLETQQESEHVEKFLILELRPIFNINFANYQKQSMKVKSKPNFKELARVYYNASKTGNLFDQEYVQEMLPRLVEYVNVLGLEELRTCGFQESKLKKKFLHHVGESEMISNRKQVRDVLNLVQGDWYSLKQVKDLLVKAYQKINIPNKAFASDVSKFYVTKRTRRNGVEGVTVIGDV